MKVVPQAFFQSDDIQVSLFDGDACFLFKKTAHPLSDNERFLSAHAVTVVLAGRLQIEQADSRLQIIQEGEAVLLPKGQYLITDLIPAGGEFEAMVCFFEDRHAADFLLQRQVPSPEPTTALTVIPDSTPIRAFIHSIQKYAASIPSQNPSLTHLKILEFLHLLSYSDGGNTFLSALKNLNERPRRPIRRMMEDNFFKPLGVEDYAFLSGRSHSTFLRDFRREFKTSPKKWLIEKRMGMARTLLEQPEISITQVAEEVGYQSTSHFIKSFQSRFGTSPKQFQITHRSEATY